jgi:LmbE family N-acetylglucosaminyl deacetylase
MFEDPKRKLKKTKTVAVIVAHPDDETLWAGGMLLSNPEWECFVVCLCRGSDADRAPKFYKALQILNAKGTMGDLDDGPDQKPLSDETIESAILNLLPQNHFDLIITHSPNGEYTRHIRHEETGRAVSLLCESGKIPASELWTFAYEDGNKNYYPLAVQNAAIYTTLSRTIWQKKYRLITETYGFEKDSWEAKTTPLAEAFWKFPYPSEKKHNV